MPSSETRILQPSRTHLPIRPTKVPTPPPIVSSLGFRILTKEATAGHLPVGSMVVCASTEQAAALNEALQRHGVLKSAAILSTIGQSRHRGAYRLPHRRHRHRIQNPPAYHGIQTMQESSPALCCLVQGYFFYALFAIA